MNATLRTALTAATLLGAALSVPALAADGPAYPRSFTNGENSTIEYGPAGGTVVGGGRVIANGTGEDAHITHLDAGYVQRAPAGQVPVSVGSGENSSIVWVPAATFSGARVQPRG